YGEDLGSITPVENGFTVDPDDAGPAAAFTVGGAGQRDFTLRSLRGNAVLRWEWRPGSTLYLAWQQDRSDYAPYVGDFSMTRDRRALFDAQPDNVLVLKVSYWLNP
ncbi:MAG TPA: hypothetical protein VEQ60_26200, partial [Longimicrobium sp.]|nr:hypothetical protein [Longimicrobium sp.]